MTLSYCKSILIHPVVYTVWTIAELLLANVIQILGDLNQIPISLSSIVNCQHNLCCLLLAFMLVGLSYDEQLTLGR